MNRPDRTVVYKFTTCARRTYFIEVLARRNCLTAAIHRLQSAFAVDPDRFCCDSDAPLITEVAVVRHEDVPDGSLIYAAPSRDDKGGERMSEPVDFDPGATLKDYLRARRLGHFSLYD